MSPRMSDAHCNIIANDDSGDTILLSNSVTVRELCLLTKVILIHCHSLSSDLTQNFPHEVSWLSWEKLQMDQDETAAWASLFSKEIDVP